MAPPDVILAHSHPECAQGALDFAIERMDSGGRMLSAVVWVETRAPGAADAVLEPAVLVCFMDHEPALLTFVTASDVTKKRYAEFYCGCMTVTDIRRVESTPLPSPLPPPEAPVEPSVVLVPPPASRIRLQPCAAGVLAKVDRLQNEYRALLATPLALRSDAARRRVDVDEQLAASACTAASVTIAAPAWWLHQALVDLMVVLADTTRDTLRPFYERAATAASKDPDLGGRPVEPGPLDAPDAARGGVGLTLWRAEALLQDETGSPAAAAAHRRAALAERARAVATKKGAPSRADALVKRPMSVDAATAAVMQEVVKPGGRVKIFRLPTYRVPPFAVVEEEGGCVGAAVDAPPLTADQLAAMVAHAARVAAGPSDGAACVVTTAARPAERFKVGSKTTKEGGK